MAGWRLSRADGTDERSGLSVAQVRELLKQGAYGAEDLVASPTQKVMLPIRKVAALRKHLPGAKPQGQPSGPKVLQEQTQPARLQRLSPHTKHEQGVGKVTRAMDRDISQPHPAIGVTMLGVATPTRRRRFSALTGDTDLEISPMIDVVFQLLIFFMVCSVLQKQHGVNVPPTATGRGIDAETCVVIGIRPARSSDGAGTRDVVFLGDDMDTSLTIEQAAKLGAEKVQRTVENRVVIKADSAVAFATVRDLVQALRDRTGVPILTGVREKR